MKTPVHTKIFAFLLSMSTFLSLTSGCFPSPIKPTEDALLYSIVDDSGNSVSFSKIPQKVYSTDYFIEIILLGLVPERLLATSAATRDPSLSLASKKASDPKYRLRSLTISPEEIFNMKPDLIIVNRQTKIDETEMFRGMGIPVVQIDLPTDGNSVNHAIRLISSALRVEERGQLMIDRMNYELQRIDENLSHIKEPYHSVFYLVLMNPYYGGKGCMLDFFCNQSKAVNSIAAMGIRNGEYVSKELLIAGGPDFIIIPSPNSNSSPQSKEELDNYLSDPALFHTKAYQNNHILLIPTRYVFATNQNYVWSIEALCHLVHGTAFDENKVHMITGLPEDDALEKE